MTTATVSDAYRRCEVITRDQARNFFYGIRLLPGPQRSALCAVYALARRIDDIGDSDRYAVTADRVAALASTRKDLDRLNDSVDPVLVAVADAAARFPVPIEAFAELIDGVQMDLDQLTYPDFTELVRYCRRVAGSIGRLCLSIFGSDVDPGTVQYADQLGIAMQQTNILRDVREDLLRGRVYLPQDELERFGVRLELNGRGALDDPEARLAALLRFCADRAGDWYCLGMRLVPHLDRRSAACCLAMAGIYRDLLTRIRRDPSSIYLGRLSLSAPRKLRVAASSLVRAAT